MNKDIKNVQDLNDLPMGEDFRLLLKDLMKTQYLRPVAANPDNEIVVVINLKQKDLNYIYLMNGKRYWKNTVDAIDDCKITAYVELALMMEIGTQKEFKASVEKFIKRSETHTKPDLTGIDELIKNIPEN